MKSFSEETKQRMSEAAKKRCNAEWRKAKSEATATKLPIEEVLRMYNEGMTQEEVGRMLGVSQKVICRFMKNNGMKARRAAKRNQRGLKNHMWKGNEASYKALHCRLYSLYGTPSKCEICGTVDATKNYDWASLTGQYTDISDYKRMCRSCHRQYDKSRRKEVIS